MRVNPPATAPDPAAWEPGAVALKRFTEGNPQFGLSPDSPTGFYHFTRTHGAALSRAGVMVRTHAGTWVAHREHFPSAVTALLLGQAIPKLARTKAKD